MFCRTGMVERDSRAWWKSTTKTWRTCSASVYSAPWCSYGIAKVGETVCVWPSSASASVVWTTVKWTSDGARLKFLVFAYWDSSDSLRNKTVLIAEEKNNLQCPLLRLLGFDRRNCDWLSLRSLNLFFSKGNSLIQTLREFCSTMCIFAVWIECEKVSLNCVRCEIQN